MNFKRTKFNNSFNIKLLNNKDFQNEVKKQTDILNKNTWLLKYSLNLQLFAEQEEQPVKESETIKIVKEEYEKKLKDQKDAYEQKISDLNKNHNEQIRALVSGRSENLNEETKKLQEKKELSFEEQLLKDTRKNLGLKED